MSRIYPECRPLLIGSLPITDHSEGTELISDYTPEFIEKETVDRLVAKWFEKTKELVALGVSEEVVYRQSFITPSCGTGAVSFAQAKRVLELTQRVSKKIRAALS